MADTIAEPRTDKPLVVLRAELEQRAEEFRMVLPSHITPEKLQRTILTAVQSNPDLLACDRRSFLNAAMKAAQDGLLPDGREAAIVPFNSRHKDAQGRWSTIKLAQYMPMVFGLRKKILQSGDVTDIFASVVYRQELEGDHPRFVYEEGSNRTLRHKPILDPDFKPTDADIVLAYSVATFAEGPPSFEVMRRWQIDEVRETSQTGATLDRNGQPREPKGPWVDWFAEMAKKTVIRRHSKSLPQSSDIIDVEAEDIALAARSAVAMLDSRQSDAPKLIEDGDHGFDPATGELLGPEPEPDGEADRAEAEAFVERLATAFAEAKTDADLEVPFPDLHDAAMLLIPTDAEPEPEPEPKPKAAKEPKPLRIPPDPEPEPEPDELTQKSIEPDPGVDEMGITKSPDEAQAEDYITRARNCELLVDLRALEREADMVLATMPEEIAACVDTEFDKARKRLTPPPGMKANP
jgi:recombination protein RecT